MSLPKKIARTILFPTMMGLKMDRLIRGFSGSSCVSVMYHGVVQDDSTYFSPRHITIDQFERQLKYLKANFEIISVSQAFQAVREHRPFEKKTITISFDDGFENNLTNALPLLEKYQIPTTFFISSVCVLPEHARYLWSELSAALQYFYPDQEIQVGEFSFLNSYDQKSQLSLNDLIKTSSYEERSAILQNLISTYHLDDKLKEVPEEIWKLLSREQVIELSKSSIVEIGSHGHDHYNLAEISSEKAEFELAESKRLLEEAIGTPVSTVAYPDGSYNNEVKAIAEKVGYLNQMAVSYKESSDQLDQRIMNRHGIASTTTFHSNMLFLNKAFLNKGVKN